MPRRPPPAPSSAPRPSERLLAALAGLEIPRCECKVTVGPVCLAGLTPGCRERQHCGSCPCPPRWLPECLLWEDHGCTRRREGKRCACPLFLMPSCLALGCDRRRRGKNCECPRWPGAVCQHIHELADRLGVNTPEECEQFLNWWSEQLWGRWPAVYRDRRLAFRPMVARTQAARVHLMEIRANLKRSLWHPSDVRAADPGKKEEVRLRNMADFLRQLRKEGGRG